MPTSITTRTDGKTSIVTEGVQTNIPPFLAREKVDPNAPIKTVTGVRASEPAAAPATAPKKAPPKLGAKAPAAPAKDATKPAAAPKAEKPAKAAAAPKAEKPAKAAAAPKAEKAPRIKGICNRDPKAEARACRQGSNTALMIDILSRKTGARMPDIIEYMTKHSKTATVWDEARVIFYFNSDVTLVGYGVRTVLSKDGTPTYFLVLPEGLTAPIPHKLPDAPKAAPAKAAPAKAAPKAAPKAAAKSAAKK